MGNSASTSPSPWGRASVHATSIQNCDRASSVYLENFEDHEFVDLEDDDLDESHPDELGRVELPQDGTERDEDCRGCKLGPEQSETHHKTSVPVS